MTEESAPTVVLRTVAAGDLDAFFEHLRDPQAAAMATGPITDHNDRQAFDAYWRRALANDVARTIEVEASGARTVVGHIIAQALDEGPTVSFWIDRTWWGRGITTEALRQFLTEVPQRPLFAHAPRANEAALTVLRRNGFMVTGADTGYSHERGRVVDELVLRLG